jgi:hypothetical protein
MAATFVLGQGRTREIGLITEICIHTQRTTSIIQIDWKFFIGFSEEWHRESKKKIVEFRIG